MFVHIRTDELLGEQGPVTERVVSFLRDRLVAFLPAGWTEVDAGTDVRDGVYVEVGTRAPLVDEELLRLMIERATSRRATVRSEGACPGTAPAVVTYVDHAGRRADRAVVERSDRHARHNCQLSLHKQKRLRIFLKLLERFKDLASWPIESLLGHLGSANGTAFVIGYGEGLELERYERCPHCGGDALRGLSCGNGQPVIGFLTRSSHYYDECGDCGLVVLNPVPAAGDLHHLYDWYDLELDFFDPQTLESPALETANAYGPHQQALLDHLATVDATVDRVLDVGGGTGRFSMVVRHRHPNAAVTLIDFRIPGLAHLRSLGIDAREEDVFACELPAGSYDLVSLWEVAEHFRYEDLGWFFRRAAGWLAPGGRLAMSTPDMDAALCRAIDFWAWFAPHHVTVLRLPILVELAEAAGLALEVALSESVILGPNRTDLAYAAGAHASMSARAEAGLLDSLLASEIGDAIRVELRRRGIGSELIAVFRKPVR